MHPSAGICILLSPLTLKVPLEEGRQGPSPQLRKPGLRDTTWERADQHFLCRVGETEAQRGARTCSRLQRLRSQGRAELLQSKASASPVRRTSSERAMTHPSHTAKSTAGQGWKQGHQSAQKQQAPQSYGGLREAGGRRRRWQQDGVRGQDVLDRANTQGLRSKVQGYEMRPETQPLGIPGAGGGRLQEARASHAGPRSTGARPAAPAFSTQSSRLLDADPHRNLGVQSQAPGFLPKAQGQRCTTVLLQDSRSRPELALTDPGGVGAPQLQGQGPGHWLGDLSLVSAGLDFRVCRTGTVLPPLRRCDVTQGLHRGGADPSPRPALPSRCETHSGSRWGARLRSQPPRGQKQEGHKTKDSQGNYLKVKKGEGRSSGVERHWV